MANDINTKTKEKLEKEYLFESLCDDLKKAQAEIERLNENSKAEKVAMLDKLKVEINKNIEQEDFARSVFLYEERDLDRANKCVGILEAYKKVLDMIDRLLKENEDG